jgi:hypothetical protein
MLTSPTEIFGICAITVMVAAYAFEGRHHMMILLFATGCAGAAFYALLIGSYPFMIAEAIWAFIAFWRWRKIRYKVVA